MNRAICSVLIATTAIISSALTASVFVSPHQDDALWSVSNDGFRTRIEEDQFVSPTDETQEQQQPLPYLSETDLFKSIEGMETENATIFPQDKEIAVCDSTQQQVCQDFCELSGNEFISCHEDEERGLLSSCVCSFSVINGTLSKTKSKVFKSRSGGKLQSAKVTLVSTGHFACDGSTHAEETCNIFCREMEGSSKSSCSEDGRVCQCHASSARTRKRANKNKRNMTKKKSQSRKSRMFPDTELFIGMGPPAPTAGKEVLHFNQCDTVSCNYQCPLECRSKCHGNECFCNCPEDEVVYEYVDVFETPYFSG